MVLNTIDEPGLPGETTVSVMIIPRFRFHQDRATEKTRGRCAWDVEAMVRWIDEESFCRCCWRVGRATTTAGAVTVAVAVVKTEGLGGEQRNNKCLETRQWQLAIVVGGRRVGGKSGEDRENRRKASGIAVEDIPHAHAIMGVYNRNPARQPLPVLQLFYPVLTPQFLPQFSYFLLTSPTNSLPSAKILLAVVASVVNRLTHHDECSGV